MTLSRILIANFVARSHRVSANRLRSGATSILPYTPEDP